MKSCTAHETMTPLLRPGLLSHSRGLKQMMRMLMQEKIRDVRVTTRLKVSIPWTSIVAVLCCILYFNILITL